MGYAKTKQTEADKKADEAKKLNTQLAVAWVALFLGVAIFFVNHIGGAFVFAIGVFALVYTKAQQHFRRD